MSRKDQPRTVRKNSRSSLVPRFIELLASRRFFWIVIVVFVIQAVWIALTAVYPMAFDENFHFGIIQIYAQQWSAFLTHQPAHPGVYGELVHDPSFLYHYLMSFPYRIVNAVTHNQGADIIMLRFINIGLFTTGLYFFWRLLPRFGVSRAMTNMAILMTTLIPIVPFLAGQINYDNLIMVCVPLMLGITLRVVRQMLELRRIEARDLAYFVLVGLFGSLVKYPFLPIFAACVIVVSVVWLRSKFREDIWRSFCNSFRATRLRAKLLLGIALIASLVLFTQRDLYNVVVYHTVNPDCAQVLTTQECTQYGPWGRDYGYKQDKAAQNVMTNPNPFLYMRHWLSGMKSRLYFTINTDYSNVPGLPLPTDTASIVCSVGALAAIVCWKQIRRRTTYLWVPLAAAGLYLVVLWLDNYHEYLQTNVPVAVNGRYLVILMPFLIALIGLGLASAIDRFVRIRATEAKLALALVITLLALNGGGALSYLYYAEPTSWYWPGDVLTGFNVWLRGIARALIVGPK